MFVEEIQGLLAGRKPDRSLPALEALRPRPPLERIVSAVAEAFDVAPEDWTPGRRRDDASRAVAAYLARRRFGYRAREVAAALGYTTHGGVVAAVRRIEAAGPQLRRTVNKLERLVTNI